MTYTYDNMGNVISVNKDGKQIQKYGYDKLNRIIFENNVDKDTKISYTYDNHGNILTKEENGTKIGYRYEEGTDRLVSFGEKAIAYDGMGNPTSYCNMQCKWEKGRQLKSITAGVNTATYTYDVNGLRTSKTVGSETTSYVYENGKLLRETTGSEVIDFIYGSEGIIGFRCMASNSDPDKAPRYLYRKNLFGDVTEIYNEAGTIVGKYSYTAFGVCTKELDTDGIATTNPIRYRGYYYDEESELYYLQTRYYDPEVGRLITIDDVSYIDPETINGLNLYAYCSNNPVMYYDPTGHFVLSIFLISLGLGALFGAVTGAISAVKQGEAWWKGALIGGLSGAVLGAAFGVGAGFGAAAFFGQAAVSLSTGLIAFGATTIGAVGTGMGLYALESALYNKSFDWRDMLLSGVSYGIRAGMNFGMGFLMGKQGLFQPKSKLDFSNGIKGFGKSIVAGFQGSLKLLLERTIVKHGLLTPLAWMIGQLIKLIMENN